MTTPHLRNPQSWRLLQNEGLENPESRKANHGINPEKDTFHPRTPNRSTFNQTTTGSCATSTRGSEVKDRLGTHDARTPCVELIKWPPGNPKATPRLIRAPHDITRTETTQSPQSGHLNPPISPKQSPIGVMVANIPVPKPHKACTMGSLTSQTPKLHRTRPQLVATSAWGSDMKDRLGSSTTPPHAPILETAATL